MEYEPTPAQITASQKLPSAIEPYHKYIMADPGSLVLIPMVVSPPVVRTWAVWVFACEHNAQMETHVVSACAKILDPICVQLGHTLNSPAHVRSPLFVYAELDACSAH